MVLVHLQPYAGVPPTVSLLEKRDSPTQPTLRSHNASSRCLISCLSPRVSNPLCRRVMRRLQQDDASRVHWVEPLTGRVEYREFTVRLRPAWKGVLDLDASGVRVPDC